MREPQVGPPGSRGHSLGLVGLPYLAAVHSSQPSVHSSGTGSHHPGMASGDRSSADAPSAWWPCSGTHSCTPPSFPKPTQGAAGPALKLKRVTRVAAMPKGEAAPATEPSSSSCHACRPATEPHRAAAGCPGAGRTVSGFSNCWGLGWNPASGPSPAASRSGHRYSPLLKVRRVSRSSAPLPGLARGQTWWQDSCWVALGMFLVLGAW